MRECISISRNPSNSVLLFCAPRKGAVRLRGPTMPLLVLQSVAPSRRHLAPRSTWLSHAPGEGTRPGSRDANAGDDVVLRRKTSGIGRKHRKSTLLRAGAAVGGSGPRLNPSRNDASLEQSIAPVNSNYPSQSHPSSRGKPTELD